MIHKYLVAMDDCNNDNSCLLQCFHEYINNLNTHLKMQYIANYSRWKSLVDFGRLIGNHVKLFQHNNTVDNTSPV